MKHKPSNNTLFLDEFLDENDDNNKKFIEHFLSSDLHQSEYSSIGTALFSTISDKKTKTKKSSDGFVLPAFHISEPWKKAQYKPKLTRGTGSEREGYCERCDKWFKLKTSSYWYHMNYKHGISATGRICPDPVLRDRNYRVEGFCRECNSWIVLGSNTKNVRFGWFKHWQKIHCKNKSV